MTERDSSTATLLPIVNELARLAGEKILEIYNTEFAVDRKADDSPLTAADMASHRTLCAGLTALAPDFPLFSEEAADIPFSIRAGWRKYWLIDPLDGTREFIKRNGEFTVNIALIEDHRPILGVVHVPVKGVTYFAAHGQGAFRQRTGQAVEAIRTRKTRADSLILAGSRSHATARQNRFLEILGGNTELYSIGSSLKFCLVAEGGVDLYPRFGPTSEWDTAAAHCIVLEAGGTVTDLDFGPLEYNRKESVINPDFLTIGDPEFDWKPYVEQLRSARSR